MSTIRCCEDCKPPKRNSHCHITCEEYLKEKAEWEEIRTNERNDRLKYRTLNALDFHQINRVVNKRRKR